MVSKNKKVLVTGATGFVGANLVRKLVSQYYQVHIITRKTSNKWRIKDILPKVNSHFVDLKEKNKLEKIISKVRPQVIFHLAATGVYGGLEVAQKEYLENNFISTVNLINACSKIDYQCFINTGSSSEYGPKDKSMKETDVCQPINLYALTKLFSTLCAGLVGRTQNKPIITLRLFSPYGPYDEAKRLITYAIVQALENKEINLANSQGVRDYIYIDDVVDLYLQSINIAKQAKGEIFNLGSGQQRTVSEVVKKVIKLTNSKSKINWGTQPPRPWDTERWQADIKKTKSFFKWQPCYSINEGLKKSIIWFKENLSLYK